MLVGRTVPAWAAFTDAIAVQAGVGTVPSSETSGHDFDLTVTAVTDTWTRDSSRQGQFGC
jgi:hypothetical protein